MTTDNRYHWTHKDLLDVTQLSREDVLHVLDLAARFREINRRPIKKVPTLKGKTVVLFLWKTAPAPKPPLTWRASACPPTPIPCPESAPA